MMYIYLSGVPGLGRNWRLPINPNGEFTINTNNNFETVDIFGLGQAILLRNPSLKTFGWSSYLPANPEEVRVFTGIDNYTGDPVEQAKALKNAENSIITLKIILDDNTAYINKEVIIKSFRTMDKGGEPGDIYYTIEFSEYVEPELQIAKTDPPKFPIDTPVFSHTQTQSGDTKNIPKAESKNMSQPAGGEFGIGDIVMFSGNALKRLQESELKKSSTFEIDNNIQVFNNAKGTVTNIQNGGVKQWTGSGSNKTFQTVVEELCLVKLANPIKQSYLKNVWENLKSAANSILFGDKYTDNMNTYISNVWVQKKNCKRFNSQGSSRGI